MAVSGLTLLSQYSNYASLASQASRPVSVPAGIETHPADKSTSPNQNPFQDASADKKSGSPASNDAKPKAYSETPSDGLQTASTTQEQQDQQAFEQVVAQLRARDQEVRTHEQAHLAVAGQYATGGIQYSYQTGPDGKKYAIGGSVGIDTSPVSGDPEATLQKAMVVQQAALAPAQPSSQDLRVASQASQMMAQARAEMLTQNAEQTQNDSESELEGEGANTKTASRTEGGEEARESNQIQSDTLPGLLDRQQFDIRLQMSSVPTLENPLLNLA